MGAGFGVLWGKPSMEGGRRSAAGRAGGHWGGLGGFETLGGSGRIWVFGGLVLGIVIGGVLGVIMGCSGWGWI